MSRRTTGTVLLAISALLYASRYLSAAIYGSSSASWSTELFNAMLQYVGPGLARWSLVALVVGIVYLGWAELEAMRASGKSSAKQGQDKS